MIISYGEGNEKIWYDTTEKKKKEEDVNDNDERHNTLQLYTTHTLTQNP